MPRIDTDLLGLQIVSMKTATVVGEVDALVIEDETLKVVGFLVDLGLREASVLPFGDARAVGEDAIIIADADGAGVSKRKDGCLPESQVHQEAYHLQGFVFDDKGVYLTHHSGRLHANYLETQQVRVDSWHAVTPPSVIRSDWGDRLHPAYLCSLAPPTPEPTSPDAPAAGDCRYTHWLGNMPPGRDQASPGP